MGHTWICLLSSLPGTGPDISSTLPCELYQEAGKGSVENSAEQSVKGDYTDQAMTHALEPISTLGKIYAVSLQPLK